MLEKGFHKNPQDFVSVFESVKCKKINLETIS